MRGNPLLQALYPEGQNSDILTIPNIPKYCKKKIPGNFENGCEKCKEAWKKYNPEFFGWVVAKASHSAGRTKTSVCLLVTTITPQRVEIQPRAFEIQTSSSICKGSCRKALRDDFSRNFTVLRALSSGVQFSWVKTTLISKIIIARSYLYV